MAYKDLRGEMTPKNKSGGRKKETPNKLCSTYGLFYQGEEVLSINERMLETGNSAIFINKTTSFFKLIDSVLVSLIIIQSIIPRY